MSISTQAFEAVSRVASRTALVAATRLLADQAVTLTQVDRTPESILVSAYVIAPGGSVEVDTRTLPDGYLEYWCGCGSREVCAHVAATLLQSHSTVVEKYRRPAWSNALDAVLPKPAGLRAAELCLFMTLAEPTGRHFYREPSLSVRPGMRGARGTWIRGDAKWSALDFLGAPPAQVQALKALNWLSEAANGYYGNSNNDWVDIETLPGSEIWRSLMRIQAAGVPIVSSGKAQHPVAFAQEQRSVIGQVRRDDVAVTVDVSVQWPGGAPAGTAVWVGTPAAGFAVVTAPGQPDECITLYGLDTPLTHTAHQLATSDSLVVPIADLGLFEEQYLPRLAREISLECPDESYDFPEPPRARLRLKVFHTPDRTTLEWTWQRPAHLPVDTTHEQELLEAVHAAAELKAHLIWPDLVPASHALTAAPSSSAGSDSDSDSDTDTGADSGTSTGADSGTSTGADSGTSTGTGTVAVAQAAAPTAVRQLPPARTLGRGPGVRFVAEALPLLRDLPDLDIEEHGDTSGYRASEEAPTVTVQTQETGDWFDLHFIVEVDGEPVVFSDLFTALSLNDDIFVLPSGTYFSLIGPEFDQLRAILEEARALIDIDSLQAETGIRVNRHHVDLWTELRDLGIVSAQTSAWWKAVEQLATGVTPVQPPQGLNATLRDYQQHGLSWLHFLRTHRLGGVLADEMGLGKTLQTIAMMEIAREEDPDMSPFLVVAPTSVVSNWANECIKFGPGLRVVVISAMEGRRGTPLAEAVAGAHVVITSYALFRGEADAYRELSWSGLILDEAQQIKNPSSHSHRAARTLGAPFTLVVTGTPLENNLLELWALTSLAAPGLLGDRKKFTDFYRTPIEKEGKAERLALLQRRLNPFLLRRTKDLVAADLPPKQEQVIEIELHPRHRKAYDVRFQRERQKILGLVGDMAGNRFQIFQSLTMLRQLALDPALVDAGSAPSAKLDALVELLTEAADEGHRVLVLSQFTRFLTSARDHATEAGLESHYLDGPTTNRGAVIDEFRSGSAPVFFVSLKAGGFGLNLVEADYVVLLDPWWNPAVEAQAIDRTHRIGQHRPVFVYRLVAARTIEQKVIALREAKAALFEQVLGGVGSGGEALTANDIRDLLAD